MTCESVRELLPLHAGGDLDDTDAGRIEAHLASCAACSAIAAEYAQARSALRRFDPPELDASVYAGMRGAVLREIRQQPAVRAAWWNPRWAAAAAILVAVGYLGLQWTGREAPPPPVVPIASPSPVPPPVAIVAPPPTVEPQTRRVVSAAPVPKRIVREKSSEPVRLEIQTSDPDVRIIWFATAT